MKRIVIRLFAVLLIGCSPVIALADQFYGGLALVPTSGQPDYVADGILNVTAAYETEKYNLAGWRFSYTMTNFKHEDQDSWEIDSHILAAESLFVAKMKEGLTLIGAMGPGLFQTTAKVNNSTETAMDIGFSATGSIRFALSSSMFLSGAYHYKNCAVSDDGVVDGGYQGFFFNIGAFF